MYDFWESLAPEEEIMNRLFEKFLLPCYLKGIFFVFGPKSALYNYKTAWQPAVSPAIWAS
jgi:hypothetical protein